MASDQPHVMMFPWLAFGHILPFLELAKKLALHGIKISFVSTPKNLKRLPSIPPNIANNIKLVKIALPKVNGLSENCEATIDIQQEEMPYLKLAHDSLQQPFEKIIQNDPPNLILIDFCSFWLPKFAAKFGAATAYFSVLNAAALAYMGPPEELRSGQKRKTPASFTVVPDWFNFPSLVSHRPYYAPTILQNLHFPDASGKSTGERLSQVIEESDFVIIRSCKEFEGEYIDLLEQLYRKTVLPIGVLPPERKQENIIKSTWSNTFKWLDSQRAKSVLFVGFGSEYKMPVEQIHELAHGLELSGVSFVWVLRKPKGVDDLDVLPKDFETRVSDRGIICYGWVPQMEILGHSAIGGCLFHSGWGSIVESLGFGHPLILMPMVADQGLNSKLLVEKGVGYEVERNDDGSFRREKVAESVKLVMESEEGELIRKKASEMKNVFGTESVHDGYISSFVRYLNRFNKTDASKQV